MAAYMIANLDVRDAKAFEEYRKRVEPIIARFGGRYIVRGGTMRVLEGDLPLKRVVLLEFPSVEAAQRFYDSPEYRPVMQIRLDSTKSDVVIVDGYAG